MFNNKNSFNLIYHICEYNKEFLAEDRANIIHNLFLNAFSERGNYFQARKVFDYLFTERSYLPWRTVFVHLNDFTSIMEYRQTFFTVAVRNKNKQINNVRFNKVKYSTMVNKLFFFT